MQVTAAQVKELRDKTGAGMMDAKKALVEADGDMDKAAEVLRQKGIASAEKKSGRTAAEGQVSALIGDDRKSGVVLEVNCETDFVAKGDSFQSLINKIATEILTKKPSDLDALLSQDVSGQTVQAMVTDNIAMIGEHISVRRFERYEVSGEGAVHSYIHTGGRVGVLLELKTGQVKTTESDTFKTLIKDLSLQIASSAPEFLDRSEIHAAIIEEETRVEMGKEDLANKPEEIRRKIVDGRVTKLLGQRCLVEQPFVKDPSMTIAELVQAKAKEMGDAELAIVHFTRYALGEGIEKKVSNFAEEVAAAARA
jgi:elongation factor Ts